MPAYRTQRLVEFRDTDAAGIMHFSSFFLVMEQAEHQMLRDLGMSVVYPYEGGILSWPRVSATCDYQVPLRFEEIVDIEITVSKLGNKSAEYDFAFSRDGEPVANGKFVVVCCFYDSDHPPKSIRIPDAIREKLAKHSSADNPS